MRILVQMGIPTLLHPAAAQQEAKPGASWGPTASLPFLPAAPVGKHLLMGTESDPHFVSAAEAADGGADLVFVEEVAGEARATPPTEGRERESGRKHRKPGKLQFRLWWAADGEQEMDCKVDKVKLFLRPNEFLRIAHFFAYGYPEFDMAS
jgi:hypothetical protein